MFKGELRPEISLLHMKVLTSIKAKNNVFLWYVQCCSCTRRSKTKILTTRAPPSWIGFDVVTSQRQTRHLEYGLWLLISMFLRLLISCKSQKNRLRVSSNRNSSSITQSEALWVWRCDVTRSNSLLHATMHSWAWRYITWTFVNFSNNDILSSRKDVLQSLVVFLFQTLYKHWNDLFYLLLLTILEWDVI